MNLIVNTYHYIGPVIARHAVCGCADQPFLECEFQDTFASRCGLAARG